MVKKQLNQKKNVPCRLNNDVVLLNIYLEKWCTVNRDYNNNRINARQWVQSANPSLNRHKLALKFFLLSCKLSQKNIYSITITKLNSSMTPITF